MKRIFALLIIVMTVFSMSACDKIGKSTKKIETNLDNSFSCDVKMKFGDMTCDSEIKRYGSGMWDAEFTSPSTLSGVKLSFVDDEVSASYKGLSFSVPKSALPIKSILCNLFTIIDETASKEKIEVVNDKEYAVIEGKSEQGEYTIKLDKNTGKLISFEMPNLDLKIEFSNLCIGEMQTTESTDVTDTESLTVTETVTETTLEQ